MHELTGIAFSHYVEKARWALDRFGVPYRDVRVLPFWHFAAAYRVHRGKVGRADKASTRFSTPILRTDDGRVLGDSAEILHYVSDRFAARGQELYAHPDAAKLEQHFHDQLGPYTRRAAYGALLQRPELLKDIARNNAAPRQASLFVAAYPLVKFMIQRALGVNEERVALAVEKTQREFDLVSERLKDGRPFLLGDSFSAADLSFASLAAPALLPPEYSAWLTPVDSLPADAQARTHALRSTPAGSFAMRLFREERRRVLAAT